MLHGGAAQGPERVLQALGQRHEAFATEHHLGMLPAGRGQREVIEPVSERLTGDGDAQRASVGEVGQPLLAGQVGLAEDDFLLGAVQRLPGADAALQGAAGPLPVALGVTALEFLQERDGAQPWAALEERKDVTLPDRGKRVRRAAAVPAPGRLLRRQAGILLNAVGGADGDPRLGGGGQLAVGAAEIHVQSHLLVRDRATRHRVLFREVEDPAGTSLITAADVGRGPRLGWG